MDASRLRFAKTKLSDKDAWIVWLAEYMKEEVEQVSLGFSPIVDAENFRIDVALVSASRFGVVLSSASILIFQPI